LPLRFTHKHKLNYSISADQPLFERNPFRRIKTAIECKTHSGNIRLGKTQNLTVLEALKALKIDAAWQIHMEDKIFRKRKKCRYWYFKQKTIYDSNS